MDFYTLGRWIVSPGREEEFIERWKGLAEFFNSLENPPPSGSGVLIQSVEDPSLFYSFGPWNDPSHVAAMRAHPDAAASIGRLSELCTEATPGGFQVVARA